MNETSWMFPELKNAGKYIKGREVILDTEAVGVDEKRQKLANFQATMTRRRKHEIKKYASSVPIKFYVFDILFKNGKSFMDKNYKERRKELEKTVKKGPLFEIVDHVVTNNPSEISTLNVKKRKEGLEGIMIKKTDAGYAPGRTGWRWVKMKEAEKAKGKLADTIDCVVMGYSRGRGKRAKFGLGQFLAGVRNKNKIKTITKVGTGLTDKQFKELNKRLKKITVEEKPKEYDVHKDYEPDFWVKAKEIIELAGDELTKSPKHTSGVAVRFPRLVKFRDDKSVGQITTMKEIKALYKLQKT
jgi:DNA ligase-1